MRRLTDNITLRMLRIVCYAIRIVTSEHLLPTFQTLLKPLLISQECPEIFFWKSLLPIFRYLDFSGGQFLKPSKIPESETFMCRDRRSRIRKIPVLQGKKKKLGALTRQYDLR